MTYDEEIIGTPTGDGFAYGMLITTKIEKETHILVEVKASGVTRGQTLQIMCTPYLENGNLDKSIAWYIDILY